MGTIITIAGKTVQLPDHSHLKHPFGAVLDHPLEIGAIIRFGIKGTVVAFLYHGHTVLFAIFHALSDLIVSALISLSLAGITSEDCCVHIATSSHKYYIIFTPKFDSINRIISLRTIN